MKLIHKKSLTTTLLLFFSIIIFAESGIYVGGHFRRQRTVTVPTLKSSGFTYVILFNIQVEANGDLTTDGETICKDGVYVFDKTQPYYASDVASLRQGLTSIRRVETCIGGWGSISYDNIRSLVNSQGTGNSSILYKNFKALKDKIPVIEAINNDDEHTYDVSSATLFHVMLYDLGFKTTLAPYMNRSFWQNLATTINSQRQGAVDRIDLQCYDGGAGNNPKDWNINGIKLHSGLLHFNSTSTISSKMQEWKNNSTTTGGFLWVYNDNDFVLKNYAASINTIFGGGDVANVDKLKPHITVYSEKNFGGKAVNFELGKYKRPAIQAQEFPDNSLNSVRLSPAFRIDLYSSTDCSGSFTTLLQSNTDIKYSFATNFSSWSVRTSGDGSFGGKRMYIRNRKNGLYATLATSGTENGIAVQQKQYTGTEDQKWIFTHIIDGLYKINNCLSNKTLQLLNAGEEDSALIVQGTYSSAFHQRFVIFSKDSNQYYKLMPLHSLKYISGKGNLSDTNICQNTDINAEETDWELIDESILDTKTIRQTLINVYPNPFHHSVYINTNGNRIDKTELTDIAGKIVQTDTSGAEKLSLDHLKQGHYICKIWLKGQSIPTITRIIKL